jgi:hypothetical protein
MALWWIEKKNGQLVDLGRYFDFACKRVITGGGPRLFCYKYQAKEVCKADERPVKVRIVKDKEKVLLHD